MRQVLKLLGFALFLSSCGSTWNLPHNWRIKNSNEKPVMLDEVSVRNPKDYLAVPDKQIDIIHADIDVSFIMNQHTCIGKETLLIKPYYYATDSVVLDARGMTINKLEVQNKDGSALFFDLQYDKKKIRLKLEKEITRKDSTKVIIEYIARPDEIEGEKGKAIQDDKGLYFINTDHAEPNKPVQIWTQGESQANSAWFPTIDHPNEKFTSTLTIHADKEFTILSNGEKLSSKIEGNTKTEVWTNNKPMSAYLIMMAIGEFDIIKDHGAAVPVDYYLEKKYSRNGQAIFNGTPDMINYFSEQLGVPYPWNKYSQVVVHDYVSGAMENTSATLHGEFVQKNERELVDGNNDDIIAHELFHQWFGDLVTCKSWSHLVLNEGFATYGEQLWNEHRYGHDAALQKAWRNMTRYLGYAKDAPDEPIINFNYKNPDDVFNSITYQKGSRVLNLLRSEIGDDVFFSGLKNYLQHYAYSNADVDDLRKEFELICGKDLKPFFNQWFYRGGHPTLNIRYDYIDSTKMIAVTVEQSQKKEVGLFHFPLSFRVQDGKTSKQFKFQISKKKETFYVKKLEEGTPGYPSIFVDPEGLFIGEIKDNKSIIHLVQSFYQAQNYIEKMRTLKDLAVIQTTTDTAAQLMIKALKDGYANLRTTAIELTRWDTLLQYARGKYDLMALADKDADADVREAAMTVLSKHKEKEAYKLFYNKLHDPSYSVAAQALKGLYRISPVEGRKEAEHLQDDAKGNLLSTISDIFSESKDSNYLSFYRINIPHFFRYDRYKLIEGYTNLIKDLNDPFLSETAVHYLENFLKREESTFLRYRYQASIIDIHKTLLNNANKEKEMTKKMELFEKYKILKAVSDDLLLHEEDKEVLKQLRMNGMIPAD